MRSLESILRESAARHKHLCPRQVLGARMSLIAGEILGLDLPRSDKRLLVITETDGCTVDGVIAATGCHVGGRTLRIMDFGKVAATFIDTCTEETIRIVPRKEARTLARDYAPSARNKWEAMLFAYQVMPISELFSIQRVSLTVPLSKILSRSGMKTVCETCNEEIINGREIVKGRRIFCRACVGESYFHSSVAVDVSQDDDASHTSMDEPLHLSF
jgi:formylmethanofuran dehydrogenase subunit E